MKEKSIWFPKRKLEFTHALHETSASLAWETTENNQDLVETEKTANISEYMVHLWRSSIDKQ